MKLSSRCIINVIIISAIIMCIGSFFTSINVMNNRKRIDKIESFLTHQHGYNASEELRCCKPIDDKDGK